MTSPRIAAESLLAIASRQGGFFTATQAIQAGYVDAVHGYHVQNGDWEKRHRGIYRLTSAPLPPWPDLVLWSLWSRDRGGEPQGVFSHETALQIHGLVEKAPGPIHLTVPKSFRRNAEIPAELVLHKADLAEEEVERRDGYRVTTVRRTLEDARGHPRYEELSTHARYKASYYDRPTPRGIAPPHLTAVPGEPHPYDAIILSGED
jgi:hypothetical protein